MKFNFLWVLLLAVGLINGCSTVPTSPERPVSASLAVQNLYYQAVDNRDVGNLEGAESVLERALRIEPSNPYLWFELAQLADDYGNEEKAKSMGLRAQSLAGGDAPLQRRIQGFLSDF